MDLLNRALTAPIAHPGNRNTWTGYFPAFDALHLLRGYTAARAADWVAGQENLGDADKRRLQQAFYRRRLQLSGMTDAERDSIKARVGGKEGA